MSSRIRSKFRNEKTEHPESKKPKLNGNKRGEPDGGHAKEEGKMDKMLDTKRGPMSVEARAQPASQAASPGCEQSAGTQVQDICLEEGTVYFFYKPKVEKHQVKSMSDVQRFYIIIQPRSTSEAASPSKARLLVIGKKRLPSIRRHERFFGFVEAVSDSVQKLTAGLGESHYTTKTRGARTQPPAHALGQGVYTIVKHNKGTRFAYKLEVPIEPGEVQHTFELHKEGSFVLSVKNPTNKPPGRPSVTSPSNPPEYSQEQMEEFASYSWIGAEDTALLDVEGSEILLVAARSDPVTRYGAAGEQLEELYEEDLRSRSSATSTDVDTDAEGDIGGREILQKVLVEELKEDIEPKGTPVEIPVTEAETGHFAG